MEPAEKRMLFRMYQYSRAIYRSIKDLIDPYVPVREQVEYRRAVLEACEETVGAARQGSALLRSSRADALPGHPALLPDHASGPGRLGGEPGHRRRGRLHRGADRVRRVRRRRLPLSGDDAQGEALPARAASRARVLPVAPAPRDAQGRLERRFSGSRASPSLHGASVIPEAPLERTEAVSCPPGGAGSS